MEKYPMFKFIKDNKILAISITVFLSIKLLQIFSYNGVFWDESVYIGIGKYIFSNGEIGLYEPIRPLALPLITGLLWKFGLDVIIASKIIMLLFSSGALIMVYKITKNIFDKRTANLSVLLLAFTPLFFSYSSTILTEIPSLFFALAALYFIMKNKFVLSGIFASLSFLTKFPNLILIAVLFFYMLIYRRRLSDYVKFGLSFLILIMPYFVANYFLTGSFFRPLLLASKHGANVAYAVKPALLSLFYYIIMPIKDNILFLFVFLGLFFYFKNGLYKDKNKNLLTIFTLIYFLYFTYIPNKQLRFFLLFIPMFPIFASYGIINSFNFIRKIKISYFRIISIAIISAFLLFSSLFIPYKDYKSLSEHKFDSGKAEYYDFFNSYDADAILTTDPVPAAYADKKFIPFYFFIYDENNATYVYEKEKDDADAAIFVPRSFACELFNDERCNAMVEDLRGKLDNGGELIYNLTYYSDEHLIYSLK